ncbi:MAG: NAD-dependent DNA ligase LigA [Candidatus Colwellbacteria bacterium]|nr:NAD-dependent DNA ligase LigA [Candidatus Colwellbacteria bacterium]
MSEMSEAKLRVEKLRREIERCRYAYHVENATLVPEGVLDALKKELFDLEARHPALVTPDSPTQRVGGKPLAAFAKVRHETPMMSLNDVFNENDLRAWFERLEKRLGQKVPEELYVEPKIDGLAVELVYEDNLFVRGSTRGDGEIGEDVTQNLKTIEAIPLRLREVDLKLPRRLIVRGEVFLTKKEFARVNEVQRAKGEKLYANARNIAAGSVRQLDPAVTASRRLDSFQYEIVTDVGQRRHGDEHELLRKLGFKTDPLCKPVRGLDEVIAVKNQWEKRRERLPCEIDGLVVIVDDKATYEKGGVTGKAPRGAVAYKFSPRETTTKLLNITVHVGRTGTLTPVAVLEPVEVGGVTVTHATLHNFDQIKRLGVRIGDTVVVERAGDVIPQVTSALVRLRTGKEKVFRFPEYCPIDGARVVRDGAVHRCSNPECGGRNLEALRHFVSRGGFNIEGIGPKILERFVDEGFIAHPADIFSLREGDIAALPRFGEKSARNIVAEIAAKKKIECARFIFSLGVMHVGEETARLLADFATRRLEKAGSAAPSEIGEIISSASVGELQAIPDVGPKVAESIVLWFGGARNKKLLRDLDHAGVEVIFSHRGARRGKFSGQIFVLTGSLEAMTRDEAKAAIRERGGDISESVSGATTYVIAGDKPGAKFEKSRALGVQTLTEKEFLALLASGE